MSKILLILCVLSFHYICSADASTKCRGKFTLSSPAFANGDFIPAKYSRSGENVNPPLVWNNRALPVGTKSLALIIDDPDASSAPNGLWTHWLVKDIPITVSRIAENSVPGKQVGNLRGVEEYGGPAPPSGIHRYFFKLYAMPTKTMKAETLDEFYAEVEANSLGKAVLLGRFAAPSE